MLLREALELRASRRRAILTEDLADDAGRGESGEAGKVDRRLGVTDPLEHTSFPGAQRKDVPAVAQIRARRGGIDGDANRCRTILRADASRHTEARGRVDADRVCGAIRVEIRFSHCGQAELIDAIAGHREADQPAGLLDHEVDHRGSDELRRADEIPFVLAILVVGNDDELAGANVVQRVFN